MSAAQLVATIESLVMLIFLLVLCLRLVASFRLDEFRQRMFAIRDELFDYAAAGNIGFNDPAYRLLRQSMNGFIRYAHQLTFFRVCMADLHRRTSGEEQRMVWHDKWQHALDQVDDEDVKERLMDFHFQSLQLTMNRLVLGSPILILMVAAAIIALVLRDGWQNVNENGKKSRTICSVASDKYKVTRRGCGSLRCRLSPFFYFRHR